MKRHEQTVDGREREAATPAATGEKADGGEAPSLLAGLPKPVAFSPAAFDGDPGDVCGPDGCA